MIFIYILFIIIIIYAILLFCILRDWKQTWNANIQSINHRTSFTIIVPFRNEEKRILPLFQSLTNIVYDQSKYDVIFVNDHSNDNGSELLKSALNEHHISNIKIIDLPENMQGKKACIEWAAQSSHSDFILTIDADCTVTSGILNTYDHTIQSKGALLIAGTVIYESDGSFLQDYQKIENAALVAFGAFGFSKGQPFMANGANLCFHRDTFFLLNAYKGNEHIPGGDDEFLLEKFHQYQPQNVVFEGNTNALVRTTPQPTIKDFIAQRIRWASKSKLRKNKKPFFIQLFVFIFMLSLVVSLLSGIFNIHFLYFSVVLIAVKILTDSLFGIALLRSFHAKVALKNIVLASIAQIFIIPVLALFSLRGAYTWKERSYSDLKYQQN